MGKMTVKINHKSSPTNFAPLLVPWSGEGRRPWEYQVTVAIPHLNTLEQLTLAVEMWRNQTIRPFIQIVDTGSPISMMPALEMLRARDCEIHYVRAHAYTHASSPVTVALDLSQSLCRTQYLLHTHADVFPIQRNSVAWLMKQCDTETPVVGWQMSPRDTTTEWAECVSHTATMLHMPTTLQNGLWWTMERYYADYPERKSTAGWPDTESPFLLAMRAAGIKPKLLGPELNYQRHSLTADGVAWFDHARSYTGLKMGGGGELWEASKVYMADAEREARERLLAWKTTR